MQVVHTYSNQFNDAFGMHVLSVFKLSWLECDLLSKAFHVCVLYMCTHTHKHVHIHVLQRSVKWYSWGPAQVIHWMLPHFTDLSLEFHTIHQPDRKSLKQVMVSISVIKSVFLICFIFRILPLISIPQSLCLCTIDPASLLTQNIPYKTGFLQKHQGPFGTGKAGCGSFRVFQVLCSCLK